MQNNNINSPSQIIEKANLNEQNKNVALDEINNLLGEINDDILRVDKKLNVSIKEIPNNLRILVKKDKPLKNRTKEKVKKEKIKYFSLEYCEYVLDNVKKYENNLNFLFNKFNEYINKKEACKFYEEILKILGKVKNICKDLEFITDFYIDFFNKLKKTDPKKTKKIDATEFEDEFLKKLNLLCESKKDFEKNLVEFIEKINSSINANAKLNNNVSINSNTQNLNGSNNFNKKLRIFNYMNNLVIEANLLMKKYIKNIFDEKFFNEIKNIPKDFTLLVTQKNILKNELDEKIKLSPAKYLKNVKDRIRNYANELSILINTYHFYDYKYLKKSGKRIEGNVDFFENFYDISKDVDSIMNFYIDFFNKLKKIDFEKTKQIDVTEFEDEFSKKLNLLYENKKDFEKELEEFKKIKKHIKKPVPKKLREKYYNKLDSLLSRKERLIKEYNLLHKYVKETDEFKKENILALIKNIDAIFNNKDYNFIELLKGKYTEKTKNMLKELNSKIKLYLKDISKIREYLRLGSLKSLGFNSKGTIEDEKLLNYKVLFNEDENEISTKNFYDEKTFKDVDVVNRSTNAKIIKDEHLEFIKSVINSLNKSNFNFGNNVKAEDISYIQKHLNYSEEIYDFLEKFEDSVTLKEIEDLIKEIKDEDVKTNLEKTYEFFLKDLNNNTLTSEERKELISCLKEDIKTCLEKKIKYFKRLIVTKFREINGDIISKIMPELNFRDYSYLANPANVLFKNIQLVNAHALMREKEIYFNIPLGIIKKIFDLDDYVNAVGIEEKDIYEFMGIFNYSFFEGIKKIVNEAENEKLPLRLIIELMRMGHNFKFLLESYLITRDEEKAKKGINNTVNLLESFKKKHEEVIDEMEKKIKKINEEINKTINNKEKVKEELK